jgi:hypothetical protein
MMKPDREEMAAWRDRWKLVNERELVELRAMSPEAKFRRVVELMELGHALGWATRSERELREIDEVRARWVKLRSRHQELMRTQPADSEV